MRDSLVPASWLCVETEYQLILTNVPGLITGPTTSSSDTFFPFQRITPLGFENSIDMKLLERQYGRELRKLTTPGQIDAGVNPLLNLQIPSGGRQIQLVKIAIWNQIHSGRKSVVIGETRI